METIRKMNPVAKKEHKCDFCGDTIHIGERYNRQTNVSDGIIYDWVCHEECLNVTSMLDMDEYDDGYGISEECFRNCVENYVYENHYDSEIDDIENKWQVDLHEQVKMIVKELKR